jgi:hypothetical protein
MTKPTKTPKTGTVALIVRRPSHPEDSCELVETISDEREIRLLEEAILEGHEDPLRVVYEARTLQEKEDEEFGDYVEDLLCRGVVRPEIQMHGVAWLKSKIRIEQFQRHEKEAARVISQYAFQHYLSKPDLTDFLIAGPQAQVRVRIFEFEEKKRVGQRSYAA